MIILILIILIVAVVTVFSVQNAVPVTLSFVVWRFSASLAVLVFLSILTGMVIATLFSLFMRVKKSLPGKGRRVKEAMTQDKPAQDRSSRDWSGPPNP
jgi:lipopolysaccharide assembly protein A